MWRTAAILDGGRGHFQRVAENANGKTIVVARHVHDHAAGQRVRIGQNCLDIGDPAGRHAHGQQSLFPGNGRVLADLGFDKLLKRCNVKQPVPVSGKTRVLCQVRPADRLCKTCKLLVVADGHGQMFVGCCKRLVGRDIGMRVADTCWQATGNEMIGCRIDQPGDLTVIQRQVDMLALSGPVAMAQRCEEFRPLHTFRT